VKVIENSRIKVLENDLVRLKSEIERLEKVNAELEFLKVQEKINLAKTCEELRKAFEIDLEREKKRLSDQSAANIIRGYGGYGPLPAPGFLNPAALNQQMAQSPFAAPCPHEFETVETQHGKVQRCRKCHISAADYQRSTEEWQALHRSEAMTATQVRADQEVSAKENERLQNLLKESEEQCQRWRVKVETLDARAKVYLDLISWFERSTTAYLNEDPYAGGTWAKGLMNARGRLWAAVEDARKLLGR
jgi:hypothetical protein